MVWVGADEDARELIFRLFVVCWFDMTIFGGEGAFSYKKTTWSFCFQCLEFFIFAT